MEDTSELGVIRAVISALVHAQPDKRAVIADVETFRATPRHEVSLIIRDEKVVAYCSKCTPST